MNGQPKTMEIGFAPQVWNQVAYGIAAVAIHNQAQIGVRCAIKGGLLTVEVFSLAAGLELMGRAGVADLDSNPICKVEIPVEVRHG